MINCFYTGKQKRYESVFIWLTKQDTKLKQAFLWNTTEEQAMPEDQSGLQI